MPREFVINQAHGEVLYEPEMTYHADHALIENCAGDSDDADDLLDDLDEEDDYSDAYERVLNAIEYDPADVMPTQEPVFSSPFASPSSQREVVTNKAPNRSTVENVGGAPDGLPEFVPVFRLPY